MSTSQKISIPLLLIVISLICFVGYVTLIKKSTPTNNNQVVTQTTQTEYRNNEYGFTVALPLSWKGHTIVNDTWKAYSLTAPQSTTTGPLLSVRSPLWKVEAPRQDIPVMVFTLAQWDMIMTDKIHIGAAPVNPSELGRNAKYVFALPARYNFAYLVGHEEVDIIMQSKPLRGF